VAQERMLEINSSISVFAYDYRIEVGCPFDYLGSYVIDCFDNFSSRKILFNLLKENTYYIHGGIDAFTGQIITLLKARTIDFSELFEGVNDKKNIPVTPEVVHILSGAICREFFNILKGSPKLLERFLIMDFENFEWSFLELY
jgi:molybdopterin/thiamine biosynthesis adenylyltransferase